MAERTERDLEEAAGRVDAARGYLHIDDKRAELSRLDEESAKPGFWDDAAHAQSVSKQASVLRDTIAEYEEAAALLDDARAALDLAAEDEAFAAENAAWAGVIPTGGRTNSTGLSGRGTPAGKSSSAAARRKNSSREFMGVIKRTTQSGPTYSGSMESSRR